VLKNVFVQFQLILEFAVNVHKWQGLCAIVDLSKLVFCAYVSRVRQKQNLHLNAFDEEAVPSACRRSIGRGRHTVQTFHSTLEKKGTAQNQKRKMSGSLLDFPTVTEGGTDVLTDGKLVTEQKKHLLYVDSIKAVIFSSTSCRASPFFFKVEFIFLSNDGDGSFFNLP
jgi:hypothetical protein